MQSAGSAAAKGAVPAAAESALDKLEDPQTRARVAALLGTPEMQQAMQELSGGLSEGVVKGLSSNEVAAQVNRLVGRFIRAFMTELARGLNDDLAPAMNTITRNAVDSAIDSAMSPTHQQQIDRFTASVVASVMRGASQEIPKSVGPALRKAMVDDLGPALSDMMREDFAPGMAQMVRSPDFRAAFGETAREMAHQAVLGSNEGLAELAEQKKRDQGGSPLGAIGAFFSGRLWLLGGLVVAAILALPLLWLTRERRIARRYRDEAERRNARAAALLGAMEAAPDGAWSSKLLDMLRAQLLEETTETPHEDVETAPPSGTHRPRHA